MRGGLLRKMKEFEMLIQNQYQLLGLIYKISYPETEQIKNCMIKWMQN